MAVQGHPPGYVFGTLYGSPGWQAVFAVDNSVFVWGAVLAVGWWLRSGPVMVLAGAALLHLALDFPLHHDDGRPHFWPLTTWVFESPVSYWDPRHHGRLVGAVEALACVAALAYLWRRHGHGLSRAWIALAGVSVAAPAFVWAAMF